MIGVNDVQTEVFRITDAKKVYDFFKNTPWMTYVGFWSTNRDQPGPGQGANPFTSGIKQKPYDFSKTFLGNEIKDIDPSPNNDPTPPYVPDTTPEVPETPTTKPSKPEGRQNVNTEWPSVTKEFVERCKAGEDSDEVFRDLGRRYVGLGPINKKALKNLLKKNSS
jgi:hypothetical protein